MRKKNSVQKPQYKLTPQQDSDARKDFELIERVASAALRGGASASDVHKLKAMRLAQLAETFERNMTEPTLLANAEIGRKLKGGRYTKAQLETRAKAYWPIYVCARDLVEAGAPRRGLAPRIAERLGRKAPDARQINRILEFFEALRPNEFTPFIE